ncbi:MAG: restriction endonuclease subunit S [Methylotenera sp.]|nr:MAG: restriction endonuclease subunit S [Methylotenera sp.]
MANIAQLLTEHMDIWTAADIEKKSGRGRASGNAGSVYGVKKLRELILELAVRGKLVPQDPNDEPATELLKRIQAQKTKLIAEGKLKKEKPLAPIAEDEKPFELPNGWEWVHLPNVTDYKVGKTPSTKSSVYWTNDDNGYNWVSIADLNHDGEVTETAKKVTQQALKEVFKSDPVPIGTILMSFKLTLGKISILEVPAFHNEAIISIYPSPAIDKSYLFKILPARANEGNSKSAIKGNTLNSESIAALLLPLPPLAEQHRIVTKVDELMALCDQLEQQHSNAQEAHETLVSQLLATLTQSQNVAEFNANWQRIYAHFDVLFTTEASIDALKQTLLQHGVMGKLVPQDPNDEPASELLKRIQAEKAKLIAEGKLKKEKPLAPIGEDEKPFELPRGWEWVQWIELTALNDAAFKRGPFGSSLKKDMFVSSGYKVYEQYCPINDDCSFERYFVTKEKYESMKEFAVKANDFLVSCSGVTLGRITQVPEYFNEGIINQALLRVRMNHEFVDSNFFKLLFRSPYFQEMIFENSTGSAIPNVKGVQELKKMAVPLLPIAEQQRIVAKVDELMALCDQLKTRIQQANQQQKAIAVALVAEAVAE